ncbi:hypothetical protein ABTY91_24390, partial [Escherichia coli]
DLGFWIAAIVMAVIQNARDKMCFWSTADTRRTVQNILVRAAPRHPANTSRRQIKICQRSPFLKSSNAKSWGPAGLPVGSDLVIDERTRKTLPTGGCDHAVSATT